ncbi:MAG: DNA polymerase I [Firmicutes bacterium]|nr:DNA polymerase I [Bacillota bacterium]MCL5039165.1 DNA polymerase I [Bacillota bacterium]
MAQKLILIDGNSLANRAFYALPNLSTAAGLPTNAILGFLNILFKLLEEEKPYSLGVAFDLPAPTFRHQEFTAYKAHRTGMPESLAAQLPVLKEILGLFRIPIYELEGFEADDLLGTIARQAEEKGLESIIVTGDRDALQLVSEKTRVMLTKRGITDIALFDPPAVKEAYGLTPGQLIDVKGLMGDASDNIPGVPGIGEKTALKLIAQFQTLEQVLERGDEIKEKRIAEAIQNYAGQARLSKRLATIERYVPLEVQITPFDQRQADWEGLYGLFRRLEFKSLLKKVQSQARTLLGTQSPSGRELGAKEERRSGTLSSQPLNQEFRSEEHEVKSSRDESGVGRGRAAGVAGKVPCRRLGDLAAAREFLEAKQGLRPVALYPLFSGRDRAKVRGLALAWPEEGAFLEMKEDTLTGLAEIWANPGLAKLGHELKPLAVQLARRGLELRGVEFDTSLAAYLLDPSRSGYPLEDLLREHLNLEIPETEEPGAGREEVDLPAGVDAQAVRDILMAAHLPGLREALDRSLARDDLAGLFYQVEMPLLTVLAEMEAAGFAVNPAMIEDMAKEFGERIEAKAQEIYRLAGKVFNINSTRQLGEILFERLRLPTGKKTKTGYSTSAEVLESLLGRHEIIEAILDYRTLSKLKGTYLDGLLPLIDPATERIHSTFNQTITATGRISSTEPNLQNIPIRMEVGRLIRRVFVAPPGRVLLAGDYSQIELRVLAHLSGDHYLVDSFAQHQDVHARTAAEVFRVPLAQVTPEQRSRAKAVNFGIVYGISDYGLARDIGVSRAEAREYIENYFTRYVGVKEYLDRTVAEARERGYVTTLLQRRRYLPDINSRNRNLRQFAERTAMNTPIQGSAADIIKLAMVNLHRELKRRQLQTRLILQVHDELIFEVPEEELDLVRPLVRQGMEAVLPLRVPLRVDLKEGPNWFEMKKS